VETVDRVVSVIISYEQSVDVCERLESLDWEVCADDGLTLEGGLICTSADFGQVGMVVVGGGSR
jgi:hypothetical protein